jgi:hypothetical protein
VGRSYGPEFYSFIKNKKVRNILERIAYETEEDFLKLVSLLESFGVEVLRPTVSNNYKNYLSANGQIYPPPMVPRDHSIMIGDTFYHNWVSELQVYQDIKADHWPEIKCIEDFKKIDQYMKDEVYAAVNSTGYLSVLDHRHLLDKIRKNCNIIERPLKSAANILNGALISRVGKDLYIGTWNKDETQSKKVAGLFPQYRTTIVNTEGHSDSTFCPIVPGLLVSIGTDEFGVPEMVSHHETFPGWEVIYPGDNNFSKVKSFLELKQRNKGKWWVPGEELNNEFIDFVESWISHWLGYVEETIFDVNILNIDEKNVIVNSYNEKVFRAFERYGITPHVVNFRHRYFWDGGIHCITSDIHREGTMKDYFPERG